MKLMVTFAQSMDEAKCWITAFETSFSKNVVLFSALFSVWCKAIGQRSEFTVFLYLITTGIPTARWDSDLTTK